MKNVLVLHVDYICFLREKVEDNAPILETARKLIGCEWIEIVRPKGLPDGYVLLVDEEGALKDQPWFNVYASYLYGTQEHGWPICGNAVIAKTVSGPEGEELEWLDDEEYKKMHKLILKIWPEAFRAMRQYQDGGKVNVDHN